jgi:hypothetical protein
MARLEPEQQLAMRLDATVAMTKDAAVEMIATTIRSTPALDPHPAASAVNVASQVSRISSEASVLAA